MRHPKTCSCVYDRLKYQVPQMTSFHALDEVAEYDLELAQNARDGGNLPLWYRKEGTLGFANGFPGLGPAMRMWSRSPGSDRLAQLSDVTRCVTKFATDPFCTRAADGGSARILAGAIEYDIDGRTYRVKAHPISADEYEEICPSAEDQMQMMSIGSREVCDFCNIPCENLRRCSRCHGISYCGVCCQKNAYPRHRDECLARARAERIVKRPRTLY